MGQTENNLKTAFAGESQANRTYLAFAKKAEAEGYGGVAELFKAAAAAETVHAHNHLEVLNTTKSTLENLQEAYNGEHHEFTEMYPEFIETSNKEGTTEAFRSFHYANEVEKVHGDLYQKAIDSMKSGNDIPKKDYYVCPTCGYTVGENAPDKCPVCGAKEEMFNKV
jgi:rubrerythrin